MRGMTSDDKRKEERRERKGGEGEERESCHEMDVGKGGETMKE